MLARANRDWEGRWSPGDLFEVLPNPFIHLIQLVRGTSRLIAEGWDKFPEELREPQLHCAFNGYVPPFSQPLKLIKGPASQIRNSSLGRLDYTVIGPWEIGGWSSQVPN